MDLLNQFKDFLFSQKDPPAKVTVKNYLSDTNHFIHWYEKKFNKSFSPKLITHQTIEQYKTTNSEVFSQSSMDRHLSSLRKFFKFLMLDGQISHDPFQPLVSGIQHPVTDPWHIKDFKNFLYVYNASHLTIKNYIIDTRQFFTWAENVTGANDSLDTKDKNILNRIDNSLLEEYKNRLINEGNFSPATVNRKLSSLRKYLNWAIEEKYISDISHSFSNLQENPIGTKAELQAQFSNNEAKNEELENTKYDIQDTKYSSFPPIRLFQKTSKAIVFAFDQALTIPFTKAFDKASYLTWLARGKPVFAKLKAKNLKPKNLSSQSLLGISNIKKEFYAPLEISTKYFPWYKKTWFALRYKRPKWYTTYHSYPIAHYFNFAILTIFMAVIGFGFYQSFFQKPTTGQPALAALPNAPLRILSFQGRLTDNQDNPISTSSALRFAIYNTQAPASGSALLWQEVDSVNPDQDGIFSVLLGNAGDCPVGQTNPTGPCGIPNWLFASNSALFLGVSVNTTPEMTPRQQLATVAFAANSETLQGLAPITQSGAGTSNVVLALDSSGNLTIGGTASPIFQASGGQFTMSGQPLLLTTNTGSNGNVTLSADGLGKIAFNKPLISTSNSNNIPSAVGSVEVDSLFSILATSSGQSAFTINQTGGGPLISASQSGTAKFTVDASGNTTIAAGSIFSVGTTPGLSLTNACVNTTGGIVTGTGTCPNTGANWWNQLAGALSPVNTNNDFLLGSTATSTAEFAFTGLGLANHQTQASVSGNLIVMANNGYGGNVGIGTTTPAQKLQISAGYALFDNGYGIRMKRNSDGAEIDTLQIPGGTNNLQLKIPGSNNEYLNVLDSGGANLFTLLGNGRLGIGGSSTGITSPLATLDVRATSGTINSFGGTIAVASISGATSFASLVANNDGVGDLFTASASGWTRFTIANDGSIVQNASDTTGNGYTLNANSLTTGTAFSLLSTSTGLSTGGLASLYWNPGSATTATGDLLSLNVGANGTLGNIFNVQNNSSSVFSVSQSQITANLPTQFTSAGDVSMAYDLNFTNPTASYIKSAAPLYVQAGETFNSSDLTLRTFNAGNIIADSQAFVANYAATISGQLVVGTQSPNSSQIGALYVTNANTYGEALAILNQTESQDIFTASASGTPKFTISNSGALTDANYLNAGGILYTSTTGLIGQTGVGTSSQCLIGGTTPSFGSCATGTADSYWNQTLGALYPNNSTVDLLIGGSSTASAEFAFTGLSSPLHQTQASVSGNLIVMPNNGYGGNVGIGLTNPSQKLDVSYTPNATFTNIASDFSQMWMNGSTNMLGVAAASTGTHTYLVTNNGYDFNVNISGSTTPAMTINTSNNVGIGITPVAKLDVNGNIALNNNVLQLRTGSDANHGITYSAGVNGPQIYGYYGVQLAYNTGTGIQTPILTATQGNVGINTTVPTAKLDVAGDASTSADLSFRGASTAHTVNILDNGTLNFTTSPGGDAVANSRLFIQNNGNVGIGTTNPGYKLDVNGSAGISTGGIGGIAMINGFVWNESSAVQLVGTGTTAVQLGTTKNTPILTVATTGNVGIGTTTPTALLDVKGTASISGLLSFYAPGSSNFGYTTNQGVLSALGSFGNGRLINRNTDFESGDTTGYSVYNNLSNGSVSITNIASSSGVPNSSGRVMKVTYNGSPSTATPGFGGFSLNFTDCGTGSAPSSYSCYREGTRIMHRIWAKIPVGYNITWASNAVGTGTTFNWITSQAGTGEWQEYIGIQYVGAAGTFSSTGYYYLAGSPDAGINWFVASVQIRSLDESLSVDKAPSLNVGYKTGVNVGWGEIYSTGKITTDSTTGITLTGNGAALAFTGTSSNNSITTASNQALSILPNGSGILNLNTAGTGATNIGTSTNTGAVSIGNSTGTITLTGSGLTANTNSALYLGSSGVLGTATTASTGLCLVSGASTPSWSSCSSAASNYWQLNLGALSPFSNTADLLIGGTSTASAEFAFTGLSSPLHQTQASVSGNLIVMPNNGYGGHVGIGTRTPTDTLDLASLNQNEIVKLQLTEGTGTNGAYVGLKGASGTNDVIQLQGDSNISALRFGTTNGTGLDTRIWRTAVGTLQIDPNGAANNMALNIVGQGGSSTSTVSLYRSTDGFAQIAFSAAAGSPQVTFGSGAASADTRFYRSTTASTLIFDNNAAGPLYVGIGVPTSATLSTLDIRGASGTLSVASASGKTSFAALVANNNGVGDLFTASQSGWTKFVIKNNGNVGIGTTSPGTTLTVGPYGPVNGSGIPNGGGSTIDPQIFNTQTSGTAAIATGVFDGTNNQRAGLFVNSTNGLWGLSTTYSSGGYPFVINDAGAERLRIDTSGNVGIGTTSPTSFKLQVAGSVGPNTTNSYDLGSSSLQWRNIYGTTYYSGGTVGVTASLGCVSSTLGIVTGSGSCPGGSAVNWWNQLAGALSPINLNNDLLIGGSSTASAEFAFTGLGLANHQTQASFSGQLIVMPNNGYGGNVGIGTSTPNNLLQVANLINFDNGNQNTALGYQALSANESTTYWGTAIGYKASQNDSGTGPVTSVGTQAAMNNQGSEVVAIGASAAQNNKADLTTAVGDYALMHNNYGQNTAVGYEALYLNTDGSQNAALGRVALSSNTTGSYLTGVGDWAGINSTLGSGNTFIGAFSGVANTVGGLNTFLGYKADANTGSLINATAIGARAYVTQDNSLILGSINGINGATASASIGIGTTTPTSNLQVVGGYGSNALLSLNQLNSGNIITASASGTTKLVINNSGYIGIGDNSPSAPISIMGSPPYPSIKISETGGGSQAYIALDYVTGGSNTSDLVMGTNTTNNAGGVVLMSRGVYGLTLTPEMGVGIGTVNPKAKLNVNGYYQGNALAIFNDTSGVNDILTASASGSTKFVIANNGNVGIGTSAPVDTLDLRGNSGTTAVASISGKTSFAALVVDNSGTGDLITASSSAYGSNPARTQFTVTNTGLVKGRAFYDLDNPAFYLDPAATGTSLSVAGGITAGNILPMTDNTYTLGSSPSARWKSLFLGPGSLHIQCLTTDAGCPASQNIDYQMAIDSAGTLGIGANVGGVNPADLFITQGGNVGIGTTTPTGIFSVGPNNDWYVSNSAKNTLNTAGSTNTLADGWINWHGYNDGTTQFRNFNVGNGKGTALLFVDGGTGNITIGNGQTVGASRLDVRRGASPGDILTLNGGTSTYNLILGNDDTESYIYNNSSIRKLTLGVNSSKTNFVIDTTGNVGIGTAAPLAQLQVQNGGGGTLYSFGNMDPASWSIGTNLGTTTGAPDGLAIGWNRAAGSRETDFINSAPGYTPGGFNFYTWDGTTLTNRMAINSSGNVAIPGTLTVTGATAVNGGLSQGGNTILNGSDTWLRTTGTTGWYSATYNGGIYMTAAGAVQVYGVNKFDAVSNSGSGGYISSGNYAGTGNAAWFPSGIYSTGTNWLYGSVVFNGAVSGATSFTCSNCITQADVGASAVGTSETKTGTGSNSTAANTGENITMNDYGFFPSLTDNSVSHQHCVAYDLNVADPGNTIGRIHPSNTDCAAIASTGTAVTRWRYITASDHPTIWSIVDANGKIINTWEAEDPVDPTKYPENPNPLEGTELKQGQYFLSPEFPSVPEIKKVYDALPATESAAIMTNLKNYIVDKRNWLNDLTSIDDLEKITPRYYHSGRQWAYRYLASYFNMSTAELLGQINTVVDGKLYTVADPVGTINAWKDKETARIQKETQDAAVSKSASGSADLAEWYSAYATNLEPGDVLGIASSGMVGKAQEQFSKRIIGVISTSPDKVMGNKQLDSDVSIALNGRVPTKVSSENGPIEPGDPLTISSIPGVAAKAIKAGNVIGKALESYSNTDPTVIGKINVFVNLSWYDPDVYLTHADVKNFSIAIASPSSDLKIPSYYSISDILGKPMERVGVFSEAVIANLKTGAIDAQEIATKSLTINGQNLQDYIAGIVQNVLNNGSYISPIASTDQINTNLISPLATGSAVAIKLDNNKVSILNSNSASGSAVASIDNQGNATFSGQLSASSGQFGDATISGTLHAGKILASDIVGLNIQAATVSANYITNVTNIYNSSPSASNSDFGLISGAVTPGTPSSNFQFTGLASSNFINIATFSSQLAYVDNLNAATASFSQGLMVFGPTSLSDTSIVGQLSIDGNLILSSNSINVLGGDLQIQPLKQGGLSVMAGLFYIDTSGNLTVGGDATFAKNVTVKGTLAANTISPIPGNDLTLATGNSNLEVKNASNSSTLSLNNLGDLVASGSGTFGKLNLSLIQPAFALSTTEVIATGSAGTAQINAHQTEITIDNPLVTDKSLIYVTPKSNQVIYLMRQVPGVSFTVGVSVPTYTDIPFNWIIVN